MPNIRTYIIPILLLVISMEPGAVLIAQSGGHAGSFQRMGFGPRGMAMGNALTAVDTEGVYPHYNPALAADTTHAGHRQVDISTAVMAFDRKLHMIGAHFLLPPGAGIGVQLLNARVGSIDGRTTSGYHTGMLSTNEYQLSTQFAIRFHRYISGGVGLKFNMADYHPDISRPVSFGGDIGLRIAPGRQFKLAITVQDLIASYQWDSSELYGDDFRRITDQKFPVRFKMGISYTPCEKTVLAFEYEFRRNPDEDQHSGIQPYGSFLRIGSRYAIHERLDLRAGLRYLDIESNAVASLSAGFSINLPFDRFRPSIDYAFVQEPNRIANLHVFALRLII